MRRVLAAVIALVSLCAPGTHATTLSGTVRNPDGSGFNGQLIIRLLRGGVRNTCVTPSIVVPTAPVVANVVNGAIQGSPNIVPNDCFSAFVTYSAELHDGSHALVSNSSWWVTQPDGAAQATGNKYLWPAGLANSAVGNQAVFGMSQFTGGYATISTQTGNVSGSSSANVLATWPPNSFSGATYAVACSVLDNTSPLAPQIYAASIVQQTAQSVTVSVTNQNASPRGGTLICRGHA